MYTIKSARYRKCALACVFVLTLASGAFAELPDVLFEVTAQSGPLSVTVPILSEWGEYDPATQTWQWTSPQPIEFWAQGGQVFLGSLNEFDASVVGDPEVNLNFAVQAGASNMSFSIASALLNDFDPITEPMAYAHASYTLTDFNGDSASLTGIGATGGAYLAQYNGWAGAPMGPQGTTFAEGIDQMNVGPIGTITEDFDQPGSGYMAIGETVFDMSALISFELTASDLASGTSNYVIIPEPAGLVALALFAALGLRRR